MENASTTTVKAGDTLEGRYKIIRPLGEGGMGTVFLAEHMLIKRRVAIKILRSEFAADADVVERFMNEARAAGAIGHPHIVESTDMGFTRDEVPFIVFEYLEGTLLTDEIYRVGGLPPRRALRIASQIASALSAAHSAGIVHRDLKSDNIFLTDKEEGSSDHVKVLDFGISRFLEAETSSDSSNRHSLMGTPEFMAPEQITTPEKVDRRVDIYALGVVLYEMLSARRPFDFDTPMQGDTRNLEETDRLLHRIVTEDPTPMNKPGLPPGLEHLIHEKLLAKNPDDRFESMKDVQAAFEAFFGVARRDSEPIPVASIPTPVPLPPAADSVALPPAPKRKTGFIWVLAVLLAGGAAAYKLVPRKQTSQAGTTTAGQDDSKRALQDAADKFCSTLDSQAQAQHMRAEGIASLPMLRAAIETDAATLADMVKDRDLMFQAQAGEVLEIFQERDGKQTTMLRIPAGSPGIPRIGANETHLETDGTTLQLVVGAPVSNQHGTQEGVAALVQTVDLSSLKQALGAYVTAAALSGLGKPVMLVGTTAPASPTLFPCKASKLNVSLSLAVTARR
ncbi:MAG TPA: serine/threonine-protein kinase [Kofleriaceae bacterium]|nr:serine/threonine-protein kinase [Kofleriaceae bacterium]